MDQHLSIEKTGIQGLYVVNPASYKSDEDLIVETYNSQELLKNSLNMTFVQENQSMSVKGVLRGLHVQKNFPQGKLVRVVRGKIYDVAVDTRTTSSTYGDWYGVELSADNKKQFYQFAEAIENIVNLTPEARNQMAAACKKKAEEFDVSKSIAAMKNIYQEVLSNDRKYEE